MNKYRAKKTMYNGVVYDSIAESQRALNLDLYIKAKEVDRWQRQVKFSVDVNGKHICNYFLDFKVWWSDGSITFEDVKGVETPVFKLKKKLVEAIYNIKITLIYKDK